MLMYLNYYDHCDSGRMPDAGKLNGLLVTESGWLLHFTYCIKNSNACLHFIQTMFLDTGTICIVGKIIICFTTLQ